MTVIKLEFDYCGLCPFLGQKILVNNLDSDKEEDYKTIIYCTEYHGRGIPDIVRELTKEEYDNIPDWCHLRD